MEPITDAADIVKGVWHAYVDKSGKLLSLGTVPPEKMPEGVTAYALPEKPDDATMWDESSRTFVPRPVQVMADRVDDVMALIAKGEKTEDAVAYVLHAARYRIDAEDVRIGWTGDS